MKYVIAILCLLLVVVAGCSSASAPTNEPVVNEPVVDAPSNDVSTESIEAVDDLLVEESDSVEIGELI
jgi:hypothetical protein